MVNIDRDELQLISLFLYIRCCCVLCNYGALESAENDKLRMKAFQLSNICMGNIFNGLDFEPEEMLRRATELLDLRMKLHFKLIHQLEAAEAVFNLAMIKGDVQKAKDVAAKGEVMAKIRWGMGIQTSQWKRRKEDPILYIMG